MGKIMDTLKTGTGVILANVAKEAYDASKSTSDPAAKAVTTVVGSFAGAAAYHILKDDAVDLVKEIKGTKKD